MITAYGSPLTVHRSPFTVGRASVKPITSNQYPLPAKRPRNPVTDKDKIKRVFGVEMPQWGSQLRFFIANIVASDSRAAVTPGKA